MEVSSAALNGFERRSLLFTLSSVMINLASDAGSVDDAKVGVEWATRLLDDAGSPAALIPQAAYNRANGLAEMFGIEEADSRQPRVLSSSPAYRLAHLNGLREVRMLYRRVGSDPLAPTEIRGRALCNLGNVLDESGRWAEAYSAYSDALQADPTNGNAAGNIAELLRRRLGRRVDQRGHLAAVYDHYVAMAQSLRERTIELAGTAAADRWDVLEPTGSPGYLRHAGDHLDATSAGLLPTALPLWHPWKGSGPIRRSGTPRPSRASCGPQTGRYRVSSPR